jgi:NADH-quinone oxidoreductase subunit C
MMREYKPKDNVQKKSYYNDRFWVAPKLPRKSVYDDAKRTDEYLSLQKVVDIKEAYIELDHLVVWVEAKDNFKTIKHIKEILAYDMLMEMSAIDYIAQKGGFEIFYEFLSLSKKQRLRVKTFIKKDESIESIEPLYRSADWSEREMYDMFGIKANNHPNLKRILMPDDWHDHPLLKTYPMQGDEIAQWYEVDKIFGKEARDIIGPEIRDQAVVDRYDTQRFALLGHEVPKGAKFSHTPTKKQYQEDGGVGLFGVKIVTPFDEIETKNLKERK